MNGPYHYRRAESLLETSVSDGPHSAQARQTIAIKAAAHAMLAQAAAIVDHGDDSNEEAWSAAMKREREGW